METFSTNNTYLLVVPGALESNTPYMQYTPSRNVAYGVGGVFGALVLSTLVVQLLGRAHVFSVACVSGLCLLASQFLRGSLADPSQLTMYQISVVLNTCGAQFVLAMSTLLLARWVRFIDGREPLSVLVAFVGTSTALGAVVLSCIGVPMAWSLEGDRRRVAHLLLVSGAAATLGASGIGLVIAAWKASTRAHPKMGLEVVALMAPLALLCVWASFSLAQLKLPLRTSANTSEVSMYVLNQLPLALALLVWTVVNAPRRFCFDLPSYRASQRAGGHAAVNDQHYEYPSLPADHDFSYPVRVHHDLHRLSMKDAAMYPHQTASFSDNKAVSFSDSKAASFSDNKAASFPDNNEKPRHTSPLAGKDRTTGSLPNKDKRQHRHLSTLSIRASNKDRKLHHISSTIPADDNDNGRLSSYLYNGSSYQYIDTHRASTHPDDNGDEDEDTKFQRAVLKYA
ncbi:hypothetical protein IWW50_000280 [Coemansia erecta]|nr:hypothetical protein IWW50_000280 [Coemansia erecta]